MSEIIFIGGRMQMKTRDYIKYLQKENKDLQQRIDNATDRLEALIIFWKKYNPVDNYMQVEQFNSVIDILNGGINDNDNRTNDYI